MQVYAKEKQKELGFERLFVVYHAFKAHKTDNVKVLLAKNNTNLAPVPAGGTSKYQPLDVYINKSFKGVLRNFGRTMSLALLLILLKLRRKISRKDIVNLIPEGINYL